MIGLPELDHENTFATILRPNHGGPTRRSPTLGSDRPARCFRITHRGPTQPLRGVRARTTAHGNFPRRPPERRQLAEGGCAVESPKAGLQRRDRPDAA